MYIWDLEDMLESRQTLRVSDHALREAHKEGLHAKDVMYAIFNGQKVENYPDRKRMLVIGPALITKRMFDMPDMPVHVVCDYSDDMEIVVVTVYIPNRPKWMTTFARGDFSAKRSP